MATSNRYYEARENVYLYLEEMAKAAPEWRQSPTDPNAGVASALAKEGFGYLLLDDAGLRCMCDCMKTKNSTPQACARSCEVEQASKDSPGATS